MKILVLSDSHSSLRLMRISIAAIRPDAVIHLGDYYEDGERIAEENPDLVIHQVPGNCDLFRALPKVPDRLCYDVGGVRLLMVHGHRQGVKCGLGRLLAEARAEHVAAALYGHTHEPDCHREPDGLWVLNPGTCGYSGGTVGLIETDNHQITDCRILRRSDLEELK